MEIITMEGGRLLDLVPLEEMRPPNGVYIPEFITAIAARYGFVSTPKDLHEAAKTGAKFEMGKFISAEGEEITIKEFSVYSDGLICEAHTTDFAEFVLDDFIGWSTETFHLQERVSPIRRTYTSAIICQFDNDVESGLGKLMDLLGLMSGAVKEAYGWDYKFNLSRLAFNVDPKDIPHLRATNFVLERRHNYPYDDNRYYSLAPLKTEAHVRLLETMENELLSE